MFFGQEVYSTYRVCWLSRFPVRIRPYYVVFDERKSSVNEIDAIRNITQILRKHPNTQCVIDDVTILSQKEVELYGEVAEAFERLWERSDEFNASKVDKWRSHKFKTKEFGAHQYLRHVGLSTQFFEMAHLSYQIHGIEVCSQQTDGLPEALKVFGGNLMRIENNGLGHSYVLNPSSSDEDLLTAFKYVSFPIIDINKDDEKDLVRQEATYSVVC